MKKECVITVSAMKNNIHKLSREDKILLMDLYNKNYYAIYNYVNIYISDTHLANDITSDVFAITCEKFESFKSHPNPTGWLYVVAQNKIHEMFRLLKSQELLASDTLDTIAAPDNYFYELTELKATISSILSAEEYEQFLQYFIWNYSLEKMSALYGVSKNNMSVRLSRIRLKIKDTL